MAALSSHARRAAKRTEAAGGNAEARPLWGQGGGAPPDGVQLLLDIGTLFRHKMEKILGEITHNGYIKRYPDGSADILATTSPVFRERGWERSDKWEVETREAAIEGGEGENDTERAKRRARSAVRDLALSNPFRYFVTFTLDAACVDRYDSAAILRKLNVWLDNRVRRNGLLYVLVPELHKDGAVHFHGLINDALPVVDSGTLDTGSGKPRKPRSKRQRAEWLNAGAHVVYNLPAWGLGFSTAIELYGDRRQAINYVLKYISKSADKVGGRWYYSGGKLQRPSVEALDLDFDALAALPGAVIFEGGELRIPFVKVHVEGERAGEDEATIFRV